MDKVSDIKRYRISSIEPNLLTTEIIDQVAQSEKFVPHFHVPLQSGSEKILKSMRRRYQRDLYAQKVDLIKKVMPHCCIGVDVIAGFPGETHEDFMDTYHFINELDISYLHVFTYSERANTPAADMGQVVPMEIRRERNEMLRILSQKKRLSFTEPFMGTVRKVLFENARENDIMYGFTDNYIKVSLPKNDNLLNTIADVHLQSWDSKFETVSSHLAP